MGDPKAKSKPLPPVYPCDMCSSQWEFSAIERLKGGGSRVLKRRCLAHRDLPDYGRLDHLE